jgi:hypothetical protein
MPALARPATTAASRNRGARVATDHGDRLAAVEFPGFAEHVGRGNGQVERQLGGQVTIGEAPYPIRTEQSAHPASLPYRDDSRSSSEAEVVSCKAEEATRAGFAREPNDNAADRRFRLR